MKNLLKRLKKANENVLEELCKQCTSLQITVLKYKKSHMLLIANTHLFYHPDCDHLRLLQLQISFLCIQDVVKIICHQVIIFFFTILHHTLINKF